MHPVTEMLIKQAEAVPGYSVKTLFSDLLQSQVQLISYKQAAEEFGLSQGTIKNWVHAGRLPKYGWGKVSRINRNDLLRMILEGGK